jgi:adenine/guanine phosphoribosyltransferase-like PRPP-binding protein
MLRHAIALKPPASSQDLLYDAFHDRELVAINGRKFVINPLTEQIPATSAELLLEAAQSVCSAGYFKRGCKVVGEEDKGAVLVAAVSLISGLPFGLARWVPSGLTGQISVDFDCEYHSGKIYLNGVERSDKVIIVDDLISTGGTMIALVKAIRTAGAEIQDIICVAEKIEYGGVERVRRETGCEVKCLVRLSIAGKRSKVVEINA